MKRGLRNLRLWRRVIWNLVEGDYSSLVELMRHWLRLEAAGMRRRGIVADAKRIAKQMDVCAALLGRLSERPHSYWARARWRAGERRTPSDQARHSEYLQNQDTRYLGHLLGKHLLGWWD